MGHIRTIFSIETHQDEANMLTRSFDIILVQNETINDSDIKNEILSKSYMEAVTRLISRKSDKV